MKHSQHIIARIGETDQLSLKDSSPRLSLERADLRLQLVTFSTMRQEQVYFLQEAIVLLEQARVADDTIEKQWYVLLSLDLAKAYMLYFEITREEYLPRIVQQILKPLAHYADGDVYFFLAYASVVRNEIALTRYWLSKYIQSPALDLAQLQSHSAFAALHHLDWFKTLLNSKFQ